MPWCNGFHQKHNGIKLFLTYHWNCHTWWLRDTFETFKTRKIVCKLELHWRLYQSFDSIVRSFKYVLTQCNNVAKDRIAFWWCFSIMWYEGSNLGSADRYAIGVDIMPKQTPELRRLRVSFSHFVLWPRSHPLPY